jgi:hypothetical protein
MFDESANRTVLTVAWPRDFGMGASRDGLRRGELGMRRNGSGPDGSLTLRGLPLAMAASSSLLLNENMIASSCPSSSWRSCARTDLSAKR